MRQLFTALLVTALIAVSASLGWKARQMTSAEAADANAELSRFAEVILGGGDAPTPEPADDGGISLESAREVLTIGTPNAGRGDTLYDAANKIQNNFYELFNSVYTNAPPSLTYTNMVVSDGTDSVTAAEIIDSTDDAVLLRTLSGTSTGAADLGTFTGDIIADSSTVKSGMQALETDVDALQTLSGVADAATNLGTFTGNIVTDGSATVKSAIQELETDLDAVQTLSGVADAATNLGTFTGDIITDGSATVKSAFQEIETDVDALQTLSGVADAAVNLGTFTGDIIADSRNVKTALQDLETDLDAVQTLSGVADAATNLGTFTGTTIADNRNNKQALQDLETKVEAVDLADFHRDGSVAATGNFNLGGFQITNVGNVDGRDVSVLGTTLDEAVTDITEMRTLSGTADEATTLGTFTGDIISDNTTIKNAVQQLETDLDAVQTLSGVADAATTLGTFTGDIISDNTSVKTALQELETDTDALQTLSGVADAAADLGTFTGTTIADSRNVKTALQDLETEVEDRLPDFVQWRIGKGPGYFFDGTNDYLTTTLNIAGYTDFAMSFDFAPESVTGTQSLASDYAGTTDFGYHIYMSGTAIAAVVADGTVSNGTRYQVDNVFQAGVRYNVVISRASGVFSFYINGEKLTPYSVVTGSGYTGAIFAGANAMTIGRWGSTSSNFFRGHIFEIELINRAVTDAEAVLLSRGQRLGFADRGATGTVLYSSNRAGGFDTSVDGFSNNAGLSSVAITDGVSDGTTSYDDVLTLTSDSSTGTHRALKSLGLTPNKRYRVTGRYYIPISNTLADNIVFTGSSSGVNHHVGDVVGEWTYFEAEFTNNGSGSLLIELRDGAALSYTGASGDLGYVRDITYTQIGEVLSLLPSGIDTGFWYDASGNSYTGTNLGATAINLIKHGSIDAGRDVSAGNYLKVGTIWIRDNSGTPEYSNNGGGTWTPF